MRSPIHTLGMVAWSKQVNPVISVCTDVEFDVVGICVRLSTLSEWLLGQNKQTYTSKYQVGGGGPTGRIAQSWTESSLFMQMGQIHCAMMRQYVGTTNLNVSIRRSDPIASVPRVPIRPTPDLLVEGARLVRSLFHQHCDLVSS